MTSTVVRDEALSGLFSSSLCTQMVPFEGDEEPAFPVQVILPFRAANTRQKVRAS